LLIGKMWIQSDTCQVSHSQHTCLLNYLTDGAPKVQQRF